jgi:microcystin degradation protein MlrC
MKIGLARLWHESNSFSSALTDLADFAIYDGGTLVGAEVLEPNERRDEIRGFVNVLAPHAELVPLFSAGALPAGLISTAAAEYLETTLREQLAAAGQLDGICFAPHGAISAQGIDDFDGHLLQIMQEHLGPDAPIVTALDCHAVVTQRMIDASTALVAYRTHPHTDQMETGERAARILLDVLEGRSKPVVRTCRVPIMSPPPDAGIHEEPLKSLFETFISWDDRENVIGCTLCPTFPWQDVPEQSMTAIAVTDNDPDLAQELADELGRQLWEKREQFLPVPMISVAEAMGQAAAIEGCPVVITDSADTVGGGAPGDNSCLLKQAMAHRDKIDGLIITHLPDAPAIAELADAKVGDTVQVEVGGKRDTRFCKPLPVTATINCITHGPIDDDFGAGTTPTTETGTIICLAFDNVRLVLTEHVIHGPQPSLYRKVGIEPYEAKVVMLKTGVGFKKAFAPVASAVFRADCPGAESYNFNNYEFTRVPRPIYPLDGDFEWEPGS